MIVNLICFNLAWLGLIFIGNTAIAFVLLWLIITIYNSNNRYAELQLVISITLVGSLVDAIFTAYGVLMFNNSLFIPLWLVVLWAAFSATITSSLMFLSGSKLGQFIFGFVFAPLSYLAGASLSKVDLGFSVYTTYFILAPIWGCLFVSFFLIRSFIYSEEKIND